jgi:hypothetical protein
LSKTRRLLLLGFIVAVVLVAIAPLRRAVLETGLSVGAAALGGWIERARVRLDAAAVTGAPPAIAAQLCHHAPPGLLGRVRYRVGWDRSAWLSAALFDRFGQAVTLGDLIVFRDAAVAANPVVWAHELAHVRQYAAWGIDGFARRYVSDARAVEQAAWAETTVWAERAGGAGGC